MTFIPAPLPTGKLSIEQAIARVEGFYVQGQVPNRPQRNNNPGDIEFDSFSQKFGATHGDPRFAVFPTIDQGFACLSALLRASSYIGLTLEACINRYAPPSENNTGMYVAAVCHWTGRQPTDVLSAIFDEQGQ